MNSSQDQLTRQMDFVQSTNLLIMKNQTLLQDILTKSRSDFDKTISQLQEQIYTFSQLREQDRKTLHTVQMARETDKKRIEKLEQKVSQLEQQLEDPKL